MRSPLIHRKRHLLSCSPPQLLYRDRSERLLPQSWSRLCLPDWPQLYPQGHSEAGSPRCRVCRPHAPSSSFPAPVSRPSPRPRGPQAYLVSQQGQLAAVGRLVVVEDPGLPGPAGRRRHLLQAESGLPRRSQAGHRGPPRHSGRGGGGRGAAEGRGSGLCGAHEGAWKSGEESGGTPQQPRATHPRESRVPR